MEPERTGNRQAETQFKPGQSGNPYGRPVGSRNKLTDRFFHDFLLAWEQRGAEALVEVATNDPSTFVRVAAQLMAKDVNVTADVSEAFAKLWGLVSDGAATQVATRLAGEPGQPALIRDGRSRH